MTIDGGVAARRAPSLVQLLDPAMQADPHPLYRALRGHGPVIWDPYIHSWIVTGYAEAVTVFQDFLSARTPTPETFVRMGLPMLGPAADVMRRQMMFMDGPRHMRVRAACSTLFTASRVRALEQRMGAICVTLLATLESGVVWDLHASYAAPLPAIIMTEIAGLPAEDWGRLQRWSDDFAALIGNFHQSATAGQRLATSLADMTAYIDAAIAVQRAGVRHGLIGALIDDPGHDRLDDEEIIANLIITLVGGLGTVTNLISSGCATLIAHPDAMAAVRSQPSAMRGAVEEMLRYETPSQFTGRIAPRDTDLGGVIIARGDAVMVMTAAANRDPAMFADPDLFDIRRTPNRHLAFAWGPHFCFGATLARIEAGIAFTALLAATRAIALTDEPLVWRNNLGLRGLTRLEVVAQRA